ncbi:PH domain-containing protein [Raoultibacter massiliensis]|uniref:PH domain-containing protein n=1 Tax=Raoultibacter massiliensis TaxID=1852371 RepID=UPI003A911003
MTEEQRHPESGMPPVPPGAAPAQQPYSQPNQQPYQQPAPGYYPSQPMPAQPAGGYVDPAAAGWQQPVQNSTEPMKHRVHHSYIWLGSLQVAGMLIVIAFFSVFSSVIGAIADGESIGRGDGPVLLIVGIAVIVGLIVIVGLTALIQTLSYKHLYYEIGPDEFNLYSGIFNKKRVHVPYQRIQSVNQKATLVQRLAGVCTVNIDTAGGSANKAVVIPYLQNSEAERLRTELFARKQAILSGQVYQDAIPGQPGSQAGYAYPAGHPAAGNVLDMPAEILTDVRGVFGGAAVDTGRVSYEYGMSNKELVLTGLSNNTGFALIILAAIGSIAGLAEQILSTAIGRMLVDNGIDFVTRSFAGNTIWAITGIVVAVFLVVWVFSIIGACISYGGFKARRRDSRIEVEHGLLQHRFHGVDIDRVQSVIVKQSFIRRLLGYCELSLGKIDAAVENSSEDQQKSLAPQGLVIHPFVKMDRVPEILAGLVPEFADVPTESRPVAKPALRRAIIRRGILQGSGFWLAVVVAMGQIVVNAVVSPTNPDAVSLLFFVNTGAIVLYVLCVLLLVLDVIGAVLWYRGSGFAYNRRFMQISNGGFSRESVSFPRKKIQYGFTKTNPFQRNARVATINARTAAGIGGTTLRLIDVTEQDAETWLDWVKPGGSMVQ